MSKPGFNAERRCRYASRPRRRALFRCTAFPNCREKTKAIRLAAAPLCMKKSRAPAHETRFPRLKSTLMSADRFKRSSLGNGKRFPPPSAPLIRLLLVRCAELGAPLRPPALQNKPPALRFHSCAKPKFSVPLNLTRLICPFHGTLLCFLFFPQIVTQNEGKSPSCLR